MFLVQGRGECAFLPKPPLRTSRLDPVLEEEEKRENLKAISHPNLKKLGSRQSMEPGKHDDWHRTQEGIGCAIPPAVSGYSTTLDGKLLPLGPHIEFKIIDYGVGEFNETLAQAAGGYQPEETLREIHKAFSDRGIPVGKEGKVCRQL